MGAGGLHVDQCFRQYLQDSFYSNSKFDEEIVGDLIYDGMKEFQQHSKPEFVSDGCEIIIKVAGRRVNEPSLQISGGNMTIPKWAHFII